MTSNSDTSGLLSKTDLNLNLENPYNMTFSTIGRYHPFVEYRARTLPLITYRYPKLPKSFDGRRAWRNYLSPILSQGHCGSTWSSTVVQCLADIYNIFTNNENRIVLSTDEMIYCPQVDIPEVPYDVNTSPPLDIVTKFSSPICANHCIFDALDYLFVYGVSESHCFNAQQLIAMKQPSETSFTSDKDRDTKTKNCKDLIGEYREHCLNPKIARRVFRSIGSVIVDSDEEVIMSSIYKYGPVISCMTIYSDFLLFNGIDLYTGPSDGAMRLNSMGVRIIGWGEKNEIPYWIIDPNFGASWGLGGYFYMKRGIVKCMLEYNVASIIPDVQGLKLFDPRIKEEMTYLNPLYKLRLNVLIDEFTKYPIKTLEMIKSGLIKGSLDPLIANPENLPRYDDFFAYRVESEALQRTENSNMSIDELIVLSVIIIIIIVAITNLKYKRL